MFTSMKVDTKQVLFEARGGLKGALKRALPYLAMSAVVAVISVFTSWWLFWGWWLGGLVAAQMERGNWS